MPLEPFNFLFTYLQKLPMLPWVTNQIIFNICLYGVYSRCSWDLLHYVIAMAESTSHREILAVVSDMIIELNAKLNKLKQDLDQLRDDFCSLQSDVVCLKDMVHDISKAQPMSSQNYGE